MKKDLKVLKYMSTTNRNKAVYVGKGLSFIRAKALFAQKKGCVDRIHYLDVKYNNETGYAKEK